MVSLQLLSQGVRAVEGNACASTDLRELYMPLYATLYVFRELYAFYPQPATGCHGRVAVEGDVGWFFEAREEQN